MSNLTVNVVQEQAVILLAQAQASLSVVVQALQQAIAAAQTAGAGTVSLSTETLQAIALQIGLAAEAVVQARVRQMQQAMVRIRSEELNIRVRARQMQTANILAQARVSLQATLRTVQRLLTTAQATGGMVTVTVADAQQILAEIQASLSAVVQAAVLQRQTIQILMGQLVQ